MHRSSLPEDLPHLLVQIGYLSDALKAEFDLVGTRMTWLISSQAFLVAAFAASLVGIERTQAEYQAAVRALIYGIPCLAAFVCSLVALGIQAAHSVADRIKNQRDEFIGALPSHLRIELVSTRDKDHLFGNLPARIVPWTIAGAWLFIMKSLPWPPV